MIKTKFLSIRMYKTSIINLVSLVVFLVTSLAAAAPCHSAAAPMTAPSPIMKAHKGRGFTISLPSNWSMDNHPSGMSYCAATDGKRVTRDAGGTIVSIFLGLAAGYQKTDSATARDAAQQIVRSYQEDNPGLSVIRRQATKINGFPAESVLLESATGRGGELERSWMLFVVKNGQLFLAAFTSPARDYNQVQGIFAQIARSIHLTVWK